MAQKSVNFNMRINPDIKERVEGLYENFGITMTDAINMFLHMSLIERGLPFTLNERKYNAKTEEVINAARKGEGVSRAYANFDEMWGDLNV